MVGVMYFVWFFFDVEMDLKWLCGVFVGFEFWNLYCVFGMVLMNFFGGLVVGVYEVFVGDFFFGVLC